MEIISIHQPNYAPWLGYFYKILKSNKFVFLDDVCFSKNRYANRTSIFGGDEKKRWLTVPVSFNSGQQINTIYPTSTDWVPRHIDTLHGLYKNARNFKSVWPDINDIYKKIDISSDLSRQNSELIIEISKYLGLECQFLYSSSLNIDGVSDDRLISIINSISKNTIYLSGNGAKKYQDLDKFINSNIDLKYTNFVHPFYKQWSPHFQTGLSILDAIFHLGWKETFELLDSTK